MRRAVWLLVGFGCGGTRSEYCERVAAVQSTCESTDPGAGSEDACEDSIGGCSEADLGILGEFASCIERIDCVDKPRDYYDCAAILAALGDPSCGS